MGGGGWKEEMEESTKMSMTIHQALRSMLHYFDFEFNF
jgi:hypothetical protein